MVLHPRRARASATPPARWSSASGRRSAAGAFVDRQGQPPPFHGQGDPRAARGGRPHAGPLSRHGRRARSGCPSTLPFDWHEARPHDDLGLRHGLLCRARRQVLVRALRTPARRDRYRLGVPLPRGAAAGAAGWRSSSPSPARRPTRWLACATPRSRASTSCRSSTCRPPRSPARATSWRRHWPGPEIGVASTKAFTCQLTVLACLAIAAGLARGTLTADARAKRCRAN